MDLDLRYLRDLDAIDVAWLVLLVALVPFLVSAVTCRVLRGRGWKRALPRRVGRLRGVKRAVVVLVAMPAVLTALGMLVAIRWLLADLAKLPWGFAPALAGIALGVVLGVLVGSSPRPRLLKRTAVAVLAVTAVVVVLFARQFEQPAAAELPILPGTPRPTVSWTQPTTPTGEPTATPTWTVTEGAIDPRFAKVQGARYVARGGVCSTRSGATELAVEIQGLTVVSAFGLDGVPVRGLDVADLLPCTRVAAGEAETKHAVGQTLSTFDGRQVVLQEEGLWVVAYLDDERGDTFGLVWHQNADNSVLAGLLPIHALTK